MNARQYDGIKPSAAMCIVNAGLLLRSPYAHACERSDLPPFSRYAALLWDSSPLWYKCMRKVVTMKIGDSGRLISSQSCKNAESPDWISPEVCCSPAGPASILDSRCRGERRALKGSVSDRRP